MRAFTAGPAGFFGLSLNRGSNLRYSDCFLSADSLNLKKNQNVNMFRTCNYSPIIWRHAKKFTHSAATKLFKIIDLPIKVIGHD